MAILTAVWYLLMRIATEGGVPYLGVAFWQCAGASAIAGTVILLRRKRLPLSRRHLVFYAISGLFGAVVPYVVTAAAAPRIPVGVLGMGLTIEPALTYLIALPLLLERFRSSRFAGILLGVAGLLLIVVPEAALPSPAMVPWVILALALPVSQAIWSTYLAAARPPAGDSQVLTFGLVTAGAAMLLPAALATDSLWWLDGDGPNTDLWWPVAVLAVMNSFGWIIGFEAVRLAGPVFYSAYSFIAVPLTIAIGMVVFAEHHSSWIWGALVLLLASLYLVNMTMTSARRRTETG
jgi:drug/metabolite transporter (DMT)-like permease